MRRAFVIPDLSAIRGDAVEREKEMRWKGAEEVLKILDKGYTVGEAAKKLRLEVSPLHFAMALLESRGQKIEDPFMVAALFGIQFGGMSGGPSAGGALGGVAEDEELISKWATKNETMAEFLERIQTGIKEHVEVVRKLHDEVFSYTLSKQKISSQGGSYDPTLHYSYRRQVWKRTFKDGHHGTWSSYQDGYVSDKSQFFQTMPWRRQDDQIKISMRLLANKLEDLRKERDTQTYTAQKMKERQDYSSIHDIKAQMEKTEKELMDAVYKIEFDIWASECNNIGT